MAKRGYTDMWDFKDKHLDPNIDAADANKFMSAARCILYAAPAAKGTAPKAEFQRIGVVQGYSWGESKQVDMIFELGSDIPYLIPGRTTGQISIQRVLLSGQDLLNLIFNSDVDGKKTTPDNWIRSIRDVNVPLDLMFCFYGEGNTGKYDAVYTRFFKNCWFTSRQESIQAGQILVAESVSLMYEYCSDLIFA